jgi:solute carrier family 13 (sodium-dependent dicarboxylate transporter), member 2/3/5
MSSKPLAMSPGTEDERNKNNDARRTVAPRRLAGLILGPVALGALLLLPPPPLMDPDAWRTTAIAALMAVWWISEAIPIPATAMLPLALFPILDVASFEAAAAPYANPIIFLFLGGFVIAQAMQRWELHRRVALRVIGAVGTRPVPLIGGFMIAAAFLSMWISNTATAVMMLPIGLSVIQLAGVADEDDTVDGDSTDANFAVALMLGIAYACSIGGLGTLIGTPPNAFLAGYFAEHHGVDIGFGQWMLIGIPVVLVGLPIAWLLLTRWIYPVRRRELPGGRDAIRQQLRELHAPSRGEKLVAVVFVGTALAWVTRPWLESWAPGLSDEGIAITAALLLFLLPVDLRKGEFVLDWDSARGLPWGVLILFGGGLSLAGAITDTGLADWIGGRLTAMGLETLPILVILLLIAAIVIFLTELMSNTAAAAAFLPILAALAVGIGEPPLLLAVPAALAASCAFMMPVATPPNAIVYGSSFISVPQMVRAGIFLNLTFAVLTAGLGFLLVRLVFGV